MDNNESGDEMAGAFSGYIVQSDDIEGEFTITNLVGSLVLGVAPTLRARSLYWTSIEGFCVNALICISSISPHLQLHYPQLPYLAPAITIPL